MKNAYNELIQFSSKNEWLCKSVKISECVCVAFRLRQILGSVYHIAELTHVNEHPE